MNPDAQEYIDQMALARGYVLDYHEVMAAHDFGVLQAASGLVSAAYLRSSGSRSAEPVPAAPSG